MPYESFAQPHFCGTFTHRNKEVVILHDITPPRFTHLSLFAGIGGADLAAEWAGIKTIAHSEIDPHCTNVLEKNFPGTPNLGDIRTINKEVLERATGEQSVTIISGGYPCQPFSVAGKRQGVSDDRYLWPAMLAVVKSIRPPWLIGENVAGHISMGLDTTLSDLEGEGYTAVPIVLPACAKGALHRRDRVFIVAHDNSRRLLDLSFEELKSTSWLSLSAQYLSGNQMGYVSDTYSFGCSSRSDSEQERHFCATTIGQGGKDHPKRNERKHGSCASCEVDAHTDGYRLQADESLQSRRQTLAIDCRCCRYLRDGLIWLSEPEFRRMADGIPSKLDKERIKSLGNAIVPQQIYPIFDAIARIEKAIANA